MEYREQPAHWLRWLFSQVRLMLNMLMYQLPIDVFIRKVAACSAIRVKELRD